jgi:hypothetical protein
MVRANELEGLYSGHFRGCIPSYPEFVIASAIGGSVREIIKPAFKTRNRHTAVFVKQTGDSKWQGGLGPWCQPAAVPVCTICLF